MNKNVDLRQWTAHCRERMQPRFTFLEILVLVMSICRFYIMSFNKHVYMLDGMQRVFFKIIDVGDSFLIN